MEERRKDMANLDINWLIILCEKVKRAYRKPKYKNSEMLKWKNDVVMLKDFKTLPMKRFRMKHGYGDNTEETSHCGWWFDDTIINEMEKIRVELTEEDLLVYNKS